SSPRFGTTYYSSLGRTLHTLYRSIGLLAEGDDVGLACIPRSPARRLPSDEPRHDVARGCSDQRADVLLPDQRWTLPITATVGRSPGSVVGVAPRWYLPVGDARIRAVHDRRTARARWRRVRHQRPDAATKVSCGELGGIRRLWPSVSALRFLL